MWTVLTEASSEICFFCGLVLWGIPIINAPKDTHATEVAVEVKVFDFFADNLFGIKRALLALATAEHFKVVMERVILTVPPWR